MVRESAAEQAVTAAVAAIWADVLDTDPSTTGETFFELRGQSISAVRIVARIEDELGIAVDVGALFEDPDLAGFTAVVLSTAGSAEAA